MPPATMKKPEESLSPAFVSERVTALRSTSPGIVLAAAGDLLRRSRRAGAVVVEQAERALAQLDRAAVASAVAGIDVGACRSSIERAADAAFDAAFADSDDERTTRARAAFDALMARDVVESTLFAAKRRSTTEAAGEAASVVSIVDEKSAALRSEVDVLFATSVGRQLTGINEQRRAALRDVDAALHDQCPWLTRFGGADDLLEALGGVKTAGVSEGAAAALRSSALPAFTRVDGAGRRRAGEDAEASALARVAMGTASSAERAFLDARAKRDPELARAVREAETPLEVGEG